MYSRYIVFLVVFGCFLFVFCYSTSEHLSSSWVIPQDMGIDPTLELKRPNSASSFSVVAITVVIKPLCASESHGKFFKT